MDQIAATLTLIGGPTLLIELAGMRLLTDPTFDPPGDYASGSLTLHKSAGPALSADEIGPIDAVLLSHDQHADNLDPAGRAFLGRSAVTLSTPVAAGRLRGNADRFRYPGRRPSFPAATDPACTSRPPRPGTGRSESSRSPATSPASCSAWTSPATPFT